jgi:hypothetical protein
MRYGFRTYIAGARACKRSICERPPKGDGQSLERVKSTARRASAARTSSDQKKMLFEHPQSIARV